MYHWNGLCHGVFAFGRLNGGGLFMMIVGLVLIIALVYFVFKKGNFHSGMSSETPLDFLKKRYVNGEISEEEYLQKISILKKS